MFTTKDGGNIMYKSPIELIVSDCYNQMIEQQENQVYRAIQSAGVNVDKDELVKALMYDRNQYQQGYMDGAMRLAEKIKEYYKETMFAYDAENLNNEIDDILKEMRGDC